jgi:hypothetical protein
MMRTMLWKEYREHRLIWLTMLVVNCGALIGLSNMENVLGWGVLGWRPSEGKLLMLGPVAALLVWVYGMICGAMLLAGEREEGTLNFLDTLPLNRFRLWLVKGQIGLLLIGGQIAALCGCLAVLNAREQPTLLTEAIVSHPLWFFALWMLLLGVVGMAYGLLFSARGENVMHTIGMAIIGQIIAWITAAFSAFVLSILMLILLNWLEERRNPGPILGSTGEGPVMVVCVFGLFTLAAVAGSARIFSRTDVQRLPAPVRRMRSRPSLVASWLRLVWLCDRQMRRLALGVLAASLGLGVLFLVVGPLLWPVATLLLGVLCGVAVFSDEQVNGSYRFLGEQRLPLGRVWIIKTCSRFALLLLASFVLLVPSLLVALYHSSDHSLRGEMWLLMVAIETLHLNLIVLVVPLMPYLLMWLLYGFGAGQLCGLLSRKSVVAAMIALMTSSLLAVVWLPSLAGIGLHLWQVAAPALILWATTAFLVRAWAADRLASLRTYLGVSVAAVAALLCMVYGLWYRVIEIPDVPEPFDVAAYKASLPTPEENEAGQLIRSVLSRVESVMRDMNSPRDKKGPLFPELDKVVHDGWPEGESALGDWMDKTFAENWLQPLAPLPDLPTGMVVDPRFLTQREFFREQMKWDQAPAFGMVLAARGLQQEARGDPSVFVEHLRIALALSRNLQHHSSSPRFFFAGRNMGSTWPAAVTPWLKKLRGRPDLLRLALQALIDHESKLPDEREPEKVDYLVTRNTVMNAPNHLLDDAIQHRPQKDEGGRQAELQTAAVLWLIPWEQARHQRLLRVQFVGTPQEIQKSLEWGGQAFTNLNSFSRLRSRGGLLTARSQRELANLRACQLQVALRLYQEENGDLPAALDALVPRYLKSLPRDPFANGQSFGYRRSSGEWMRWSEFNQAAQPADMLQLPGEAALMPHVDEPEAPPARAPAPDAGMAVVAAGGAAVAAGGFVDQNLPPEAVPIMPRADEPVGPPPDQRLFRERVPAAPGERRMLRFIPNGVGVLWSVGEDGQDDGGKKQGIHRQPALFGDDLIYLVPPPPG